MRATRRHEIVKREALRNSRALLRSAERLARSRSYGHATALAVLAIEEAGKGFLYHLAANRVIRFVKGKGNKVTALNERDLTFHDVKQSFVIGAIGQSLRYAPLYELARRAPTFKSRDQVLRYMERAIIAQTQWEMELSRPNSRLSKEVRKAFAILEELSSRKNRGLYVEPRGQAVQSPRHVSRREYEEVLRLAKEVIQGLATFSKRPISDEEREMLVEHRRWLSSRVRLARMAKEQVSGRKTRKVRSEPETT